MRALVILLFLLPSLAGAQETQLAPGGRVRVTAPDQGLARTEGTLEAIDGGELVLVLPARTRRVPIASVERLEVHAGQRSRPWRGAKIGFLVGAAAGGIYGFGVGAGDEGGGCDWSGSKAACGVTAALAVGAAGALVGGVVGALVKSDVWREVPVGQVRVGLAPQAGGRFALSASLAF
jgi:hypothetical protein